MNEKVKATIKSSDTDDWFDTRVVRPLAYYCAVLGAKLDMHPNTVTVLSMIVGAAAALFIMHGSYIYEPDGGLLLNVIGLLVLLFAAVLDCADGQLARLTHKSSRMGRIIDGLAAYAWYIPVYSVMVWRFSRYHALEFEWFGIAETDTNVAIATYSFLAFALFSGFVCMSMQQSVADYYIQAHLFFQKGEKGSELDNSEQQQRLYDETPWEGNRVWKYFLKSYIPYTKKQEKRTPQFQRLLAKLNEKYGHVSDYPAEVRQRFLSFSKPMLTGSFMLVFNFRTLFLAIFLLIDHPFFYFFFEAIVISIIAFITIHKHEAHCKRMADEL